MSEYTPDWTDLRDRYAFHRETHTGVTAGYARREAERGIAKIKAEAWDEGFQDGRRQDSEGDDGPRFVNPYRGQEEA